MLVLSDTRAGEMWNNALTLYRLQERFSDCDPRDWFAFLLQVARKNISLSVFIRVYNNVPSGIATHTLQLAFI
jgi:hypothetical protein